MRNLNFLRKSERKSVGTTLALTVGSPSAHRRYSALKHLTFMLLFLLGSLNVWGADATDVVAMKGFAGITASGYQNITKSGESTNGIDMVAYGYIGQTGQVRGGKTAIAGASVTTSDANKNWSLYNSEAMPGAISKIEVTQTATGTNVFQNKLYVSLGTSSQGNVTSVSSAQAQDNTSGAQKITFTIDGTKGYTYFKLLTNEKFTGGSVSDVTVTITYDDGQGGGGGSDPSLSVAPTSINFGTVYKDATVESQTVAVTFANLTGDVTYSGLLTSPFTASGTVSATGDEITIAADASTIGEYEQTLTVTSADDDKSATVTVTMNVVAAPEPTGTFALFSGALTEGDYVIYYDGKALKNTITSSRFDYLEVTPANDKLTNPDEAIIWHIAASGDYWTIYNAAVEKYAAGTGTKNQGGLLDSGSDDKSLWTVSGSSTYEFVNKKNTASSVNANLRNNGTNGFACYSTQTGGALTLYKKQLPAHELTFGVASSGHGTLAASVGGSAINSGAQVAEGATVTLTPTADTYYQVNAVEVLDDNADEVTTTENAGVYTFAMPASDAVAEVSFAYIPVTGLTLNKSALDLLVGAEETLSVTAVEPANAYAGVNWSTSAAGVAIVDETGKVTGKAEGTATITATSVVTGTVTATCAVTVTAPSGHEIGITSANGSVTANTGVNVEDVLKDVAVVLTATPNDGYSISGWTVTGVESKTISEDKTTCSFTMPDNDVTVVVAYTHEVAVLKLHDANGESTFDSENTHYWKEQVTLPNTAAACSKTFVGWSAESNHSSAPELGATYVLPNKGTNDIYAVYADAEEGEATWDEITAVPTAGTYAICSESYFLKAGISNNRFENGTTPAITNNQLTTAPASDCIWEVSINAGGKFLMKNGNNYAAATGTKNQGALITDATDTKAQWTIEYNSGFVVTNVANAASSINAVLRNNTTNGWATYAATTGSAPRFFKKNVGEPSYSNYSTTCQQQAAAPTFSVEAGTYYVAQNNIVLASTTENATIYYTTDGSDPKTSGTKQTYSAAISLSERAITTIKAYAVAEGYESSAVAEATYNINLPYSFAEFAALTPKENGKEYVVRGIISQKDAFNTQYNEIPYYISANGSTEGQIKCHNGLGLNKAEFTTESAAAVNPGDNVTVVGTWSTQYNNIGAANWMLEYTARAHDSYEIVGDLTTTGFQVGEAFDDAILANLSVKEVFTNGYEEAVAGATFNCGDKTEWLENETSLTVYAKLGDDDLTSKNFGVTVSSATLVSFELKAGYKTEYFVGQTFVKPTVVATLSDNSHVEAEATECTGYNMSAANTYDVTVSFTYGAITIDDVQYQITVKNIANDLATAYAASVAKDIIENVYASGTESTYDVYVSGKVIADANSEGTYFISDDGTDANKVQIYKGKYFDSSTSAKDNVKEGDEVIVKGHILVWSNAAEMKTTTVVSQFRAPEFAFANIVADDEFEVNISEDLAVVPTANSGDAEFTLASSDEDIVKVVDGNKLSAIAEGDAVITAHRAETANENALNYKEATTTFNVHVIAERDRYAITFANGGATGGTAPEAIDPQLAEAKVYLPENTYSWANHGFNGWAVTKTVSGDAVEIAEDANGKYITMPAAAVTITATWVEIATTKISFMVGGVEKASIDKEQGVAFTIAQDGSAWAPTGFTFVGWATEEQAEETEVAPTTITEYTPQAGVAEVSLYGIYSRVDNSAGNKHYVLNYTTDVASKTLAYGSDVNVTATDGSQWVVKAAKNNGMQLNTGKNSSIKIPTCPGKIISIDIECTVAYSVGLSASNYSGSGSITYIVSGTNAKSQTLDLSEETVTAGYIVPKGGATAITNINITYDGSKTYYTSSPAEKVTITFNANGGDGGCTKAIINKGAEFTICENVPTKSHSEFAGWKLNETTTIYQANQNIGEVEEDITLTAQWDAASTYTVTYDVNGSTADAPTEDAQYAGDQFTVAAAIAREGYTFQGWKYGSKLYKAGASFTMPAEAVEFVAQWRKASVPVDKMSMVTSASALSNGMPIALGCSFVKDEQSYFIMAGDIASGKSFLSSESENITLSDGVATYTDAVVVMTLEQVENGWKITKDGTNYLNETSVKNLAWTTKENATIWSISFSGNNVKISSANGTMKFNAQDPRFTTYASGQKDIQLFGKAVVVTEDVNISDLGYTEGEAIVASGANVTLTIDEPTTVPSITAQNGATVVIEEQTTAKSVVVEDGSKIVANAATTTPTVYFSTTMGSTQVPGTASELGSVTKITLATGGEIIYDLTLGTSMAGIQADPDQWHAFTLPFAVDALNGIYDAETGAKLQNEVNYAIMDYHGDIRANGDYGWKKYRGILQPGVFYLMTVDGNTKTFRFKAAKTGAMTQTTSMGYEAYNGSGDPSKDFGWNGIGNPSWVSGTVTVNVQVLDPYSYTYQPLVINTNITVSTPFFYNAGGDGSTGSVVMQAAGSGDNYAPARTKANEIKNVAVSFGNEVFRDKIYISASEDALNTYEQDKDLVRMIMSNTPKVAQIFGNAYGMKLAMVNAPMVNDQAEYSLTLYAPAVGEYTISAPAMDNADLYLTLNGAIIWNLSMGEYTSDFAKGNNEGYGLLLVKKAPQVTTGVENAEANETGVQKVIINEHVYILRAEQMYDVTGKLVK